MKSEECYMVQEIKIPKIDTNEDTVTLAQLCVKDGEFVTKGQLIAVFETTKETEECIADASGYISIKYSEGEEIAVGTIFAVINREQPVRTRQIKKVEKREKIAESQQLISDKALQLMRQYNINITQFPNNKVIREKDVLNIVNGFENREQSNANAILIVCGGNVARMCIDAIRLMGGYRFGGITDMYAKPGTTLMGIPFIGDIDVLESRYTQGYQTAVNAFGGLVNSNKDPLFYARKNLYEQIKQYHYFMPNIIHPKASVEVSANFGEGNLVFSGAYVGSETVVGNDCIINTGAIVSHNCRIGDHCRISPGAVLAGDVTVGENTIIGMGVTVYMKCKIGKNVIIYNGKNVFSDIPDNTIVK